MKKLLLFAFISQLSACILVEPEAEITPDVDNPTKKGLSTAKVYEFTVDLSTRLPFWRPPFTKDSLDAVFVFIDRGSSLSPLPFRGSAKTVDTQKYNQLDINADIWEEFIYLENTTTLPAQSNYKFRVVVIRATEIVGKIPQTIRKDEFDLEYLEK